MPSLAAESPTTPTWDVNAPAYSVAPRNIDIDVREGTWMSLDVSPDGQQLVFDLLGDLYTLPIEGGEARQLTTGHAWDMQPQFSPDGTRVAFTSDRAGGDNIWTIELGSGELQQVTRESFRLLNNPSWSPDGQYLAARKHFTTSRSLGTGEIWLYHSTGGEKLQGQQVVARPNESFQKELGEPAFSPDGDAIYYTQNITPGNTFIYHQDSNTELFQIRRVDLADGSVTPVAGGPGGAVRPTPSPDGKQLAYVKRVRAQSRLFVMDLASGVSRMIDDNLDLDMQETWAVHGLYPTMAWLPDNQHLVFWAQGKLWRIGVDGGERSEIPFHVAGKRSVYPVPRFQVDVAPERFNTQMVRFAQASPDGKSVVFESLGQLYVKRGDKAPQRLTRDKNSGFDYAPVWSPDSKTVYFLRWHDTDLSSLHRVSARGGNSRQLPLAKGQYAELSIDPAGNTLALRKLAGSSLLNPDWDIKSGIYRYELNTGTLEFVSKRGFRPHFGPDPQRLYVLERRESASGRGSQTAKTTLLSMDHRGRDIRELAVATHALDIRIAPDGSGYAYIDGYQIHYSAAMPSGKVLVLDADKKAFPAAQLSRVGGAYLQWSPDSSTVYWSVGAQLRQASVEQAVSGAYEAPDSGVDLSMTIEHAVPDTRLALTNARIVTLNPNREVIERGTVVITGNRIATVGDANDVAIPEDYQRVDLAGKTVIPGFVDIHAHGPYGHDDIIPQQNWNLLAHLALGVTTVHNPSSTATEAFAAAEYARADKILGPRIFSTAEIIYGAKSTYYSPVNSLEDALAHVRRLKAQGAISVKNYNQPRREQRQQIIEAARLEGLMSVAEGGSLYQQDMNLITDGITGIEHNVPTMRMYEDVTQLWRQTEVGYTPTLVVTFGGLTSEDYYYQDTEVWKHPILSNFVPPSVLQPRSVRRPMAPEEDYRDDDAAAAAKVLLDAGVLVNTGAHGQREGLATHWEMWSFARGGFSPMEALAAATINPALYLGMAGDVGSLEAGKLADLVVLDDNPLDDIRNSDHIRQVMVNGRLYRADTLEEIHTGERKLKPLYWHNRADSTIR
jgi:imidazolonepropionase-like amidohydrolase/Tol biopolymer transport system component